MTVANPATSHTPAQTSEAKDSVGHFGRNRPQEPRGRSRSSGDGREGGCKKAEQARAEKETDFQAVNSETHARLTNKFRTRDDM